MLLSLQRSRREYRWVRSVDFKRAFDRHDLPLQSGVVEVGVNTRVNHPNFDSALSGQHAHRRPTAQKVVNHLRRDFARIGAHAFGNDAVIGGDDVNSLAKNLRLERLSNRSQTIRYILQHAEAARWLGML